MRTEHIKVGMTIFGESAEMSMNVPVEPVKLRRMLPLLRQVSNGFVNAAEQQVAAQGNRISCKAGCGACCRQLVPVSEAEAFDLAELVESMPEPRRSVIRERFADGLAILKSAGFFERLDAASRSGEEAYRSTLNEYFEYGVACPFLEEESCSIHEIRPITCREYLVTSPPELCASSEGKGVQNVRQLFQLKEALLTASRQVTPEELPYVPMISALEWVSKHPDDAPEMTGKDWIGGIFKLMQHYTERSERELENA